MDFCESIYIYLWTLTPLRMYFCSQTKVNTPMQGNASIQGKTKQRDQTRTLCTYSYAIFVFGQTGNRNTFINLTDLSLINIRIFLTYSCSQGRY